MRPIRLLLPLLLLGVGPASAPAQTLVEVLQTIQEGGGWVRIPVSRGEGTLRSASLPVGGLQLKGCTQIWGGHSGSWNIRAREIFGGGELGVPSRPGEARTFVYQTGDQVRFQVDVRWSEPRDTTLLLWVGLETPMLSRDPCEPVYGGG
jgi:hypothetical protein